ncbi:MAG: ABC transporter permease [Candidatus Buchananbacteria bacterium]|nr:ABC transporter permease [Candidatus Buchananbacteria bacterium]
MNFVQATKGSIHNLASRKMRSFLTMLGMIIGISSVIVIMSIGASAQGLILNQIKGIGSNLIGILPGAADENGPPATALGITVTTLKYDDALAIAKKENAHHVVAAAAYVKGVGTISWENRSVDTNITGTTANYVDVEDAKVSAGHFFTEEEERSISRSVVLGSEIAESLFEDTDPVGQSVKIKRELFRVVGVMEERGSAFFQNQDDQVFIPLYTAQKLLLGVNHLGFIRAKVDDEKNLDQSLEDIKATLRERHEITDPSQDDFSVRSVAQALEVLTGVTNALKFFLAAIAAIALVVGGIGIMNIMLVSVNERIREIGLRKAVGAKNASILIQFLVETIVIAFGGGLIGIIFGAGIAGVVALVANYLGYKWDFIVTLNSIFLASGVSVLIGLTFGIYPAYRAAKLDPIVALRHE